MAIRLRSLLKGFFNTGDRPTEAQFSDVVDSFTHRTEDKASTAEIQAATDNTKFVTPAGAKASVLKFAPDATTTVRGLIEIATTTEAQSGTDTIRAVTPAGAKRAAETFAPVKTVNGIAPVGGDVQINTGGGTARGSVEHGVVKYSYTTNSTTKIFHLKLPLSVDVHNAMFYLKAEGHAYRAVDIIDIVWIGYCYMNGGDLRETKTDVGRGAAITAGQYVGSDNHIYLWFKPTNAFYVTFKVDSMKVGNGLQFYPGDIEVIVSDQAAL